MSFHDPRDVLRRHGLWTKKKFGQNFLVDQFVVEQIVSSSGVLPGDRAFEIGAGCGTLTRYIAESVKRLTTLEYDVDLESILKDELDSFEHVEIVMGDVRTVNWTDEANRAKQPIFLFGNLPYHLSSEIILSLIEHMGAWRRACFMVQKEFGDRLSAPAGDRLSSALSVQLERFAYTHILFNVPPSAFVPPPKIQSTVLVIEPKPIEKRPFVGSDATYRKVVRTLFSQRRKMCRKALKGINTDVEQWLAEAQIDGTRRGETLTLKELARLSSILHRIECADAS